MKIIVIGAGIGGLATAAIFSRFGHKVDIYEGSSQYIGGYCSEYVLDDCRFTIGPRYLWNFGKGEIGSELLRALDIDLEILSLNRDHLDSIHLPGKNETIVPMNWRQFRSELCEAFPAEQKKIETFFRLCENIHLTMTYVEKNGVCGESIYKSLFKAVVSNPGNIKGALQSILQRNLSLDDVLTKLKMPPELKVLFSAHLMDFAETPSTISFVAYSILTLNYHRGAYTIRGGINQLAKSFVSLIEANGNKIHRGKKLVSGTTQSKQIEKLCFEDGTQLDIKDEIVISNIDPRQFLDSIGFKSPKTSSIHEYKNSHSLDAYFFTFKDKELVKKAFGSWNSWYVDSEEALTNQFTADHQTGGYVYFNSPNNSEKIESPHGMVTAFTPSCEGEGVSQETKMERVIDLVRREFMPDIDRLIISAKVIGRDHFQKNFSAPQGAVYGRRMSPRQCRLAIPMKQTIKNLAFVGAVTAFPGVSPILKNSKQLYEMITRQRLF